MGGEVGHPQVRYLEHELVLAPELVILLELVQIRKAQTV